MPSNTPGSTDLTGESGKAGKADCVAEFQSWRKLLGKQVRVTLDNDGKVVAEGRLLAFDDCGEAVVQDEMGFLHYCWPMLTVEEVDAR